ncbi:hypothetical protein RCL_jg14007.t1 [Rhizophagus clarus]|uniref:Uncharacterized protein n=1 Tax=Rhizophagus clarus TaxID=94130 RepID=A0A8H3LV07_9GLOM|nr:hypothetical protein RCL_jg14007.t1 [Rhizophagus clarus]
MMIINHLCTNDLLLRLVLNLCIVYNNVRYVLLNSKKKHIYIFKISVGYVNEQRKEREIKKYKINIIL